MTNIKETEIANAWTIEINSFNDFRGSFLNLFRNQDLSFKKVWGDRNINQVNISRNLKSGTTRGLHLQLRNASEAKIINCLKGEIFDVVVDLRKDSKTYGKWVSIYLSSEKQNAIFVPEGCAHGFQTLEDNTEVIYFHSGNWDKDSESGIIWNDPVVGIKWPMSPTFISEKDLSLPFLKEF